MSIESVRKRLKPTEWFQDQSARGLALHNGPHAQRYELLVTIQQTHHDLALALDVIEALPPFFKRLEMEDVPVSDALLDAFDAFEAAP